MNKPLAPINELCAPPAQGQTDDSSEGGSTATPKQLMVLVEGDSLATSALMERLLARAFPQSDDDEGLSSIEVPSPYAYFLVVDVKILGDRQTWQTTQSELDTEAASSNQIIIVPCGTPPASALNFDQFHHARVSIKHVSAHGQCNESAGMPSVTGPDDQASKADEGPLHDLLNVITEFAVQEGLLGHVGGY